VGGDGVFVADSADGVAGGITIAVGDGGMEVAVEEMAGVGEVHALTRLKRVNRMIVFATGLDISSLLMS
jgi:hypothetical protein